MKSILHKLLGLFTIIAFLLFLSLSIFKFLFLSPDLIISSLNSPGVYQYTQKAFQTSLEQSLLSSFEDDVGDIDELTVGQKAQLDRDIAAITSLITQKKIQDLFETNIINFYAYLNGESEKLILYFPINEWGFPKDFTANSPYTQLSKESDLVELIDTGTINTSFSKAQVKSFYNYDQKIDNYLLILSVVLVVFLLTHYFTSSSESRFTSTIILLIVIGVITLLLGGAGYLITNNLTEGLSYWKNPSQILLGALLPPIFSTAVKYWIAAGASITLLGLFFTAVRAMLSKRNENIARIQAQKQRASSAKPLARQPQKR